MLSAAGGVMATGIWCDRPIGKNPRNRDNPQRNFHAMHGFAHRGRVLARSVQCTGRKLWPDTPERVPIAVTLKRNVKNRKREW
jgi:hypothetical protein